MKDKLQGEFINISYNIKKLSHLSNKIIIVSHVVSNNGIENVGSAHFLSNFLKENSIEHMFIKHPMNESNEKSKVQLISPNNVIDLYIFNNSLLYNFVFNIYYVFKNRKNCYVYIGVDPLNAFSGIILKKIGCIRHVIYYSVDYAIKRFENDLKNRLYHFLDRTCARNADLVFNVSKRINDVRRSQGVIESSIIYTPNISTDFSKLIYPPFEKLNRYRILLAAHITEGIDFQLILNTITRMRTKIPKIELIVIGDGPYKNQLENKVKELNLVKHVKLYGHMYHNEVLQTLLLGSVGLAIYSNLQSWTYYGDSVKAREYVGCGIPVIMNMDISPANELIENNCGFIANTQEDLENILCKLMLDEGYYKKVRANAIQYSKKMNWSRYYGIISKLQ